MFDLGIKSEGLNNRGFNNKHVITYLSMLDSAADRLQVYILHSIYYTQSQIGNLTILYSALGIILQHVTKTNNLLGSTGLTFALF